MDEDLTINQFEEILSTRVHLVSLQSRGVVFEKNKPDELALKYVVASNKILGEYNFDNLKTICRGGKAFIIYKPTGRIACEVGLDGIYEDGKIRQDKPVLLSRKGFVKSKTLRGLASDTAALGATKYTRKKS